MEKLEKKRLLQANIFEKWHDKTFDDYTGRSKNILAYLKEYCEQDLKEGLFFTGINGIGKTMLMNIVLMHKLKQGYSVHIVPYWNLVNEYTKSWRGESHFDLILRCDYLGINDFGKSFEATENSKELAKSAVEFVIDYRIQRLKPILITSNLEAKDLRTVYSNDIASKLNEACTILEFSEKDRISDDKRVPMAKIVRN